MLPRPKVTSGGSLSSPVQQGPSLQTTSEHDAELLRLVAANIPSHRGAWAPNSRAWRTFTRRQDSKELVGGRIPEEGEEMEEMNLAKERPPAVTADQLTDDGTFFYSFSNINSQLIDVLDYGVSASQPMSGSVPISIMMHHQLRGPLSISSYLPMTAMPTQTRSSTNGDVPLLPHGQKLPSSTAIRKAKYAERDRSRSMDPGALDFATGEEDDSEEEMEMDQMKFESGERARRQALKILKARSELPEAGMWRSLA